MRRRRPRALGASYAECQYNTNPTTEQIRKALLDPDTEAAYFVDNDILIAGDENCVNFAPTTYDRYIIHNHPWTSPALPSDSDMCALQAQGAERGDIVGMVPTNQGPRLAVFAMTPIGTGNHDWPCEDYVDGHTPADLAHVDGWMIPIDRYPLFTEGHKGAKAWFDSSFYRDRRARDAAREVKSGDTGPKVPTKTLLEIDGARPRRVHGNRPGGAWPAIDRQRMRRYGLG